MRHVLLALTALSAAASAAAAQHNEMPAGVAVLEQVYQRYAHTRFRTVSFLQKTTFPDGRVESAYVWRNGELTRRAGPLAATMWTLMDMYAGPPPETPAALRRRNLDRP